MLMTTKLYNILLNLAFSKSNYDDINKFIDEIPAYEILKYGGLYLFDFDFPTPENFTSEEFRLYFCSMFSARFFDECINFETENAFKLRLISLTQSIMPYYSRKIAILKNTTLENLSTGHIFESERNIDSNNENTSNSNSKSETNGENKGFNSDFPNELLRYTDIFESPVYMKDGNFGESSANSNIESSNITNSKNETKETYKSKESKNIFEMTKNFDDFGLVWKELLSEYEKLFISIM